jgi:hypothetical protein
MSHVRTLLLEQNGYILFTEYGLVDYVVSVDALEEALRLDNCKTVGGLVTALEYALAATHTCFGD